MILKILTEIYVGNARTGGTRKSKEPKPNQFRLVLNLGDVLHLPYRAEQFEAVIDSFCFHCIIGEKRKTFLSEAFRVLKHSKALIIMTKCGDPKYASYPFDPLTRCKIENGVPTRYMGLPQSIIEEVKRSGLPYWIIEFFLMTRICSLSTLRSFKNNTKTAFRFIITETPFLNTLKTE